MCAPTISFAPTPAYRRVMIFIDGGYLRQTFEEIYKHQIVNFSALGALLTVFAIEGHRHPEVIRAYYYDAIVDPLERPEEFKKQEEYFSKIQEHGVYEVKLARIKEAGKPEPGKRDEKQKRKQKQKGADVLLAVDMLAKALLNHYDIAILLSGDDDFLDLVRAVKSLTDKRVYGSFFPGHISEDLRKSLDKKQTLSKQLLNRHGIHT